MNDEARTRNRTQVLRACGASADATVEELLAYGAPVGASGARRELPIEDEPHVERWRVYADDAREIGAFEALRRRFVQLRFPIAAGISSDESYRRATRRGAFEAAEAFAPGLVLSEPGTLTLAIEATAAGRIPLIIAGNRQDFVALVQALTERNEPVAVPDAMGACIVSGLNNWDRIAQHRVQWEAARGGDGDAAVDEAAWQAEFARLTTRKALYQDRCILLSRGPYSALAATDVGLDERTWLDRSLIIRREHECMHYLTSRARGVMRNHLLDELLADFTGIVHACGRYDAGLALRCLGVERADSYRAGGRLETYRGKPPLSDDAFVVLCELARRGVRTLERVAEDMGDALHDPLSLAREVLALYERTIEELAAGEVQAPLLPR